MSKAKEVPTRKTTTLANEAKPNSSAQVIVKSGGPVQGYKGKVTTSGTSDALRFDKTLFKQHPEFKQKAELVANVIGHGTMLVSLIDNTQADDQEDPIVSAFLSFIENDMAKNPEAIEPVSAAMIARAKELTKNVTVTDDELD